MFIVLFCSKTFFKLNNWFSFPTTLDFSSGAFSVSTKISVINEKSVIELVIFSAGRVPMELGLGFL